MQGAFLVNGQLVYGPTAGIFESPNEGAVLWTRDEEKVTIRFYTSSVVVIYL
ncbi:hypothetical protein KHA80_12740 [Anaerobacillus sp. HL2]|nr:hypothetical protein KHA80_12740 [Anaerobacillus sp. HL2]